VCAGQLQDLLEVQQHCPGATYGFLPSVLELILDRRMRVVLADEDERQDGRGKAVEAVACLFGERQNKLSSRQTAK